MAERLSGVARRVDRSVRQLRLPDLRLHALGLNHTPPGQLQGWLSGAGVPGRGAGIAYRDTDYWRLLISLSGPIPALLTLFIRLFVPESEKWEKEKAAGKASHWSERDLIGVLIGCGAARAA